MKRIGILGGTFNPVHVGHVMMARGALGALGLDHILWIPAKVPPLKPVAGEVLPEDRCRMVELAIAGVPAFRLSRLELEREGPSYTVETLRQLRREQPETAWTFILGSDLLPELPAWRAIDEAVTLAEFVVVPRPSVPIGTLPPPLRRLDVPTVDISSTDIRQRVWAGQPIAGLVPDAVAQYLTAHHLYQ